MILDQLRNVKSAIDDEIQESGNVDIPIAIQAIASKSNRRDVFLSGRNQDQKRSLGNPDRFEQESRNFCKGCSRT